MAGHGELEASPEAEPVDHRDNGFVRLLDGVRHAVSPVCELDPVVEGFEPLQLLDVSAGDERPALAGEKDDANPGVGDRLEDVPRDVRLGLTAQRVHGRVVDRHDGNTVGIHVVAAVFERAVALDEVLHYRRSGEPVRAVFACKGAQEVVHRFPAHVLCIVQRAPCDLGREVRAVHHPGIDVVGRGEAFRENPQGLPDLYGHESLGGEGEIARQVLLPPVLDEFLHLFRRLLLAG